MNDPKRVLSSDEVAEAGLSDWRLLWKRIQARFDTGDFAIGLALVDRIGAAAEASNHHPDIVLTYPRVIVTLSSHDVGGITSRDLDLARQISGFAAEAGVTADTAAVTLVEWGLDSPDAAAVAGFWSAISGGVVSDGEIVDPAGLQPTVWFQPLDPDYRPADGEVAQRWHPDIWVAPSDAPARIEAALAAGGTLVDDSCAPRFWVLADAQGNRACICTAQDR